ncbi:efflux RND transporter periplasmic adaptor subunit [Granulosicoccus sp.]|nr:efflux RND transporter periplasmic adaptor subunit [Granulosicoccus sp.]MDB4222855.1 efflux RND transporter periplasmic adaptor subunit [Granulosicoccus sp.]
MKRLISIVLPIAVIIVAFGASKIIKANKPEPVSRTPPPNTLLVEVVRLESTDYPVIIRSQGTVQPTITNKLVPEVAGTVSSLSDSFVIGGEFKAGDSLVVIDRRDYDIALTQAKANLAQSDAQLQEQSALAESARAEWKALGRRGKPSALTLREPQLAAASANRDAALAQVQRAELDLQRTQLQAPYDGIVSARSVDPGQFVSRGSPIGQIHAIDSVDVRLPLSNRQLTYLDTGAGAQVELTAVIGSETRVWVGELNRVEGLDAATQQLNIIVRVNEPYDVNATSATNFPLRVGQYVNARIAGQILKGVFVIPRAALREEREVLIMTDENTIERRAVTVAWSDDEFAAITVGLSANDALVTTPLSTVTDGTPVKVVGDKKPKPVQGQRLN